MKTFLILLTALFLVFQSHARLMRYWTYQQLNDEATVIVVATPTKVTPTSERTALPDVVSVHQDGTKSDIIGAGVETSFEILTVLKGDRDAKSLTLHHFAFADPKDGGGRSVPNLVSFEPKDKKRYLLFLKREADGRYVAVSGQTDPAIAIKEFADWSLP